jgi:hypothetical protein
MTTQMKKPKKLPQITISVRATFTAKTPLGNAKHVEALLKLLESRASSFKLRRVGL